MSKLCTKKRILRFLRLGRSEVATRSTREVDRKLERQREENLYSLLLASQESLSEVTRRGKR